MPEKRDGAVANIFTSKTGEEEGAGFGFNNGATDRLYPYSGYTYRNDLYLGNNQNGSIQTAGSNTTNQHYNREKEVDFTYR